MILRAACAALVLSVAACSSSGGTVSAPSPSTVVVRLPLGVTCGHFADASEADREAWVGRLLGGLEATGEIAPITDPVSFVPGFVRNVGSLCDGSLRSDRVEPIASSLAVQSLGG